MASILIAIIYLAFVSMGLPDALLGSAWPAIYEKMGVPVSYAGLVTILIASGTVISSLLSNRMLRRFGTGAVTVSCTALTALALFGFSFSRAFWQLCLWALPYGLGAGAIDAALNNYVALNYKSRHMSWIHFFWGAGATLGPTVMGAILTGGQAWTAGYRLVGFIQAGMTLCLLASLPIWRRVRAEKAGAAVSQHAHARDVLRMPGAKAILAAFFCYCAIETTAGLWASSYMVLNRGVSPEHAARWASLFYLGITVGRFFNGFVADRFGDRGMVRAGQALIASGALVLIAPLGNAAAFLGLILIGLGCAPVYPCLLHETPSNFGAHNSQAIMGVQMAAAYTGSTLMPPIFGWIAARTDIALYPLYLLALIAAMIALVERMNAATRGARLQEGKRP